MIPDLRDQTTARLRADLADHTLPCAAQPELFFEPDTATPYSETRAAKKLRERSAAALCESCPARALCLELALRVKPAAGVWAGYTAKEIDRLRDDVSEAA
ncbi:WhiB family transcriptional regulator [Nocardiopsis sp. FIRDI 009]|uniref:WhiB family transcriptional regulator n=1 Tax=Nocardiopsis sp. FIRDI 009 TaxID=714197 RepID=UPI0013009EB7|nr:WhiB family transcriptional regulator [Nocardiopsis sp. FIRDI 009]